MEAIAELVRGEMMQAAPAAETLEAIVARGAAHLAAYQSQAYAQRYVDFVARVREREQGLQADPALPITREADRVQGRIRGGPPACIPTSSSPARCGTSSKSTCSWSSTCAPVISRARHGQAPRKARLGG